MSSIGTRKEKEISVLVTSSTEGDDNMKNLPLARGFY